MVESREQQIECEPGEDALLVAVEDAHTVGHAREAGRTNRRIDLINRIIN